MQYIFDILYSQFYGIILLKIFNRNWCFQTVFQTLIKTVDRPHAANYGLLMMWASLANAIPVSEQSLFLDFKVVYFLFLMALFTYTFCLTDNLLVPGLHSIT